MWLVFSSLLPLFRLVKNPFYILQTCMPWLTTMMMQTLNHHLNQALGGCLPSWDSRDWLLETILVLDFWKEYLCPEIPSSQACMFTRFYNIHVNITYSPSRWDSIAIQLSPWRRSSEWCNLSCSLQRRSKDSRRKHLWFDGSMSIWKLSVPLLHKHNPRNRYLKPRAEDKCSFLNVLLSLLILRSLSFSVVTAIQKDEGWCYIGCFGWSKKLVREESFFTCVACNKLMLWLNSGTGWYFLC